MNGNEPAFPLPDIIQPQNAIPYCQGTPGLTKRELFAAMAMQGMLARNGVLGCVVFENFPRDALIYADALLAELAKGKEKE